MKLVIAPVDFSEASANALSFAAELSVRAAAKLLIVNVLKENDNENEVNSKLKAAEEELSKAFNGQLVCESLIVHGSLVKALEHVVTTQRADLLVMGTKGASGLKKILLGTNTVNVITKIKVPVLVIPEVAHFEDFVRQGKNRVILATDLDELHGDEAVNILKEITLLIIEPSLKVLSVRPKNTELDYFKRLERDALLYSFRPEIEADRATVFSNDVMSGLNYYLAEHSDAGLVAMISRDTGHLIQKHYTREMASHTHLPLLILHDGNAR